MTTQFNPRLWDWMTIFVITIVIIVMALVCSCSPCQRLTKKCPPKIHDSLVYVETITDDPNYTIPDSLYYRLEFECDSNFEVILKALDEHNTGINTRVEIKEIRVPVKDKAGQQRLYVVITAQTDSIETLNRTIEKLRDNVRTVTVEKEVLKYKTRPFFTWWFIGSVLTVILIILYLVLRAKNKTIRSLLNIRP